MILGTLILLIGCDKGDFLPGRLDILKTYNLMHKDVCVLLAHGKSVILESMYFKEQRQNNTKRAIRQLLDFVQTRRVFNNIIFHILLKR